MHPAILRTGNFMTCGDVNYWGKSASGELVPFLEHCDRWDCPKCRIKLITKYALNAGERIDFAQSEYGRAWHYQISFRTITKSIDAVKWLKRAGLIGGSMIEHRKTGRKGNHYHTAALGSLDWDELERIQLGTDWKDRKNTGKKPYRHKRGDIVIKRIRIIKNAFKLHRYELGHVYRDGGQVVSYWGIIGCRKLGYEKVLRWNKKKKCWMRMYPKSIPSPILSKTGKQLWKVFHVEDSITCAESLCRYIKVRNLQWKNPYKQKTISKPCSR